MSSRAARGGASSDSDMNVTTRATQAIVIATHISGIPFLENLLRSFRGYDRYPIVVVVNQYLPEHQDVFARVVAAFPELPITLLTLAQNAFEFGALYAAFERTDFDEFFLLSHSCEVLDPGIFEVAFETHRGRSVVCFPAKSGRNMVWNAHIGKYRRQVLEAVKFTRFMPRNIYEATQRSEFQFTKHYHRGDPSTVLLYPPGFSEETFVEKYGRLRMRMAIPELIKWKTHWSASMLFDDFPADDRVGYWRARAVHAMRPLKRLVGGGLRLLRVAPSGVMMSVTSGWGWHPHYYRWILARLRNPSLGGRVIWRQMRFLRYSPAALRFTAGDGPQQLLVHDLDRSSLVLDVGGFVGHWTAEIVERYGCRVMVFEPMPQYCMHIARRFDGNQNVIVREYGLSDRSAVLRMQDDFMGSSVFGRNPNVSVEMRDVAELFEEIGDQGVDLIKINIEGGEYALLERMIEKDLLVRCRKVMVQFHDRYHPRREAIVRRASLVAQIEKTHAPVFQYPFVWEAWETRAVPAA